MIANPKKAQLPTALQIEKIEVSAPHFNYLKDPIMIDEIELSTIYVNIQLYDKTKTNGNWQTLMNNMESDKSHLLSIEKKTIIKKLILKNIEVTVILHDGKVHHLSPIKELIFENVTSDEGIPLNEVSEIIAKKMLQSILLDKAFKTFVETPIKLFKGAIPFL